MGDLNFVRQLLGVARSTSKKSKSFIFLVPYRKTGCEDTAIASGCCRGSFGEAPWPEAWYRLCVVFRNYHPNRIGNQHEALQIADLTLQKAAQKRSFSAVCRVCRDFSLTIRRHIFLRGVLSLTIEEYRALAPGWESCYSLLT